MSQTTAAQARPLRIAAAVALLSGALWAPAQAQVSITSTGTPVTEAFDGLAQAGTNIAWTDNVTILGWYSTRTTYNAGTGSSATGAQYSFGVAGVNPVTDRALGGVGSGGTGTFFWAGRYVNDTGVVIASLDISYAGEQWRDGGNAVPVAQTMQFQYQVADPGVITDADTPATGWIDFDSLDFTSPVFTTVAGALDGNAAANRLVLTASLSVAVNAGQEIWIRWRDLNDTGNDHGLAVDDLSVTAQGGNAPIVPTCPATLTTTSGTPTSGPISAVDADGTVTSAAIDAITPVDPGTITITGFTPASTVGGTATGTLSVAGPTPPGSYTVSIRWANNDAVPQEALCSVAVTVNAPPLALFVHDVQGSGSSTPIPPSTLVTVEGVAVGDFQAANELRGFFLHEEDADADADPSTSEGIFVFCGGCPTAIAEGQRVEVTGTVSEFFGMTEITATGAGSVVVTGAGSHLGEVTPALIDLPVVGDIDAFYEPREGMLVAFADPLAASEYFELGRFGQIELFEGARPSQFTETSPPSVPGYAAHLDALARRRVILDDTNDTQNAYLPPGVPDGLQLIFHPQANGGLSIGTQGVDFFRGGDVVSGLTGVLHWSFSGVSGTDAWRIRPADATPAQFGVINPRPATPPQVGGAIKAASMNLLNYFTTIDTTSSSTSGPCAPSMTLDCRGADSVAELDRQRERASIVICALGADLFGFMELENTTPTASITDLLAAVNALCGGANPYAFVDTGGTLGTDAIRVELVYRSGILAPAGPPLIDLDPVHNRPPTAQTFDVVDAAHPAFGRRFTAVANHFKSKGCAGATGGDLDQNDGQACFNATRVAQAVRLLDWITTTVLPAAGDPDVLLLGDFNSYAQEDPVGVLASGGYTDLESAILGPSAYSFLFDGQLGHLDYAFSSPSLTPDIAGIGAWHINADEIALFDYSDEIKDVGEADFEEKPDGSALVPPRVVFQAGSPFRAADHDPVLVGVFRIADLAVTLSDDPDPAQVGQNLTYTIGIDNNGPDPAASVTWTDLLPAGPSGTTFVSLSAPPGWSCTTPAVGQGGTVSCSNASLAVGDAVFTLVIALDPALPLGPMTNTVDVTSTTIEGAPGNESDSEITTIVVPVDLMSFEVE